MPTYLITGSSRGLGLELSAQLSTQPSTSEEETVVFATARSAPSSGLQKLIDGSSGRVVYVRLDAADVGSIKMAAEEVEHHLKAKGLGEGLDMLINNAGVMPVTPEGIAKMTDLTSTFVTNVEGVHSVTSAFLPLLQKGKEKKVFNISTTLGSMSMAKRFALFPAPAYKITKAALNMLTVQYAQEYAEQGFTFAAISPGWLQTDLGGGQADLTVEEGAKAVLEIMHGKGREDNGKFLNVRVKGWENNPGLNQYGGGITPW